jgi:hypothetical protein
LIIFAALATGCLAALLTGAVGGVAVGKSALGTELAAYMGGLYGAIAGGAAVVATVVVLSLT